MADRWRRWWPVQTCMTRNYWPRRWRRLSWNDRNPRRRGRSTCAWIKGTITLPGIGRWRNMIMCRVFGTSAKKSWTRRNANAIPPLGGGTHTGLVKQVPRHSRSLCETFIELSRRDQIGLHFVVVSAFASAKRCFEIVTKSLIR